LDNINLYWIAKFFTYSSIQAKLIATFLAFFLFFIIRRLLLTTIYKFVEDIKARHQWRKITSYISFTLIFIIIASGSTNLITNFIPSQYTLINFIPSKLNLKNSSIIIIIFSFFVSIFWLTYLSQIGILSFIDTFGAFFGPLFGIMISDYYLIKKGTLNHKDIYSLENSGAYFYTGGWHIKGVYSLILGFIFAASTIWNSNLMFLHSYSWIIGSIISSLTYYLLAKK